MHSMKTVEDPYLSRNCFLVGLWGDLGVAGKVWGDVSQQPIKVASQ